MRALLCRLTCVFSVFTALAASADEGMWVYNQLPTKILKERYGFEPPVGWADHLMRSSVRFNSGGSGSFVSSTGLVLTNHHVAADTLAKISTAEHNYTATAFWRRRTPRR